MGGADSGASANLIVNLPSRQPILGSGERDTVTGLFLFNLGSANQNHFTIKLYYYGRHYFNYWADIGREFKID